MTCLLDIKDFDEEFFKKIQSAEKKICDPGENARSKNASVSGRVLLGYMLKKDCGLDSYSLQYGEKGKPYLKNSDIFFNISHSGSLVMCSLSEKEIGCDVQILKEYRPRVAERFFCEREISLLQKAENQSRTFIRLWAIKESILKKEATGLSGRLGSYDFSDYISDDSFLAYGYCFSCFSYGNYEISVCSENEKHTLEIITKEEFERYVDGINGETT